MQEAGGGGLELARLRAQLRPQGILIAAWRIKPGNEAAAPQSLADAPLERRRASGAARLAARQLLGEIGADARAELPRSASGAPQWPANIVGSLAHDELFAIAAAAWRGGALGLQGIGVDIEPAEALPADLYDYVLSGSERSDCAGDPIKARLIFACKEACYKAIYPLDGARLDYHDIAIDLAAQTARLRDGRSLRLWLKADERLIAVAAIFARGSD